MHAEKYFGFVHLPKKFQYFDIIGMMEIKLHDQILKR